MSSKIFKKNQKTPRGAKNSRFCIGCLKFHEIENYSFIGYCSEIGCNAVLGYMDNAKCKHFKQKKPKEQS